jgi:hypothetical protein
MHGLLDLSGPGDRIVFRLRRPGLTNAPMGVASYASRLGVFDAPRRAHGYVHVGAGPGQ